MGAAVAAEAVLAVAVAATAAMALVARRNPPPDVDSPREDAKRTVGRRHEERMGTRAVDCRHRLTDVLVQLAGERAILAIRDRVGWVRCELFDEAQKIWRCWHGGGGG